MSRLTNRSAIEICIICNTANKTYVKVIETCRKTVFVLSQLSCINTYIKYVTEKHHKKIIITSFHSELNRKQLLKVRQIIRKIDHII